MLWEKKCGSVDQCEVLGEFLQVGGVSLVGPEGVFDQFADDWVRVDLLWSDLLCLPQGGHHQMRLASLSVCPSHVDQQPCPPLRRQPSRVGLGCDPKGVASVAEFNRDVDLIEHDVGRTELGVVVVAVNSELSRCLPGTTKVGVGLFPVVGAG